MHHALNYFAEKKGEVKIAILGDMLELGKYSEQEHQEIAEQAVKLGFDKIYLVGNIFKSLDMKGETIQTFQNVEELKENVDFNKFNKTHFLIKGSRGIRLEGIFD